MNLTFAINLKPPLIIRFEGPSRDVAEFLSAEYGRNRVPDGDAQPADFVFRFIDKLPSPSDWESLDSETMLSDDSIFLIDAGARASITFDDGGPTSAAIEREVSLDFLRFRVVDPVVTALALQHDAIVLHGSATCAPSGGVLLLGRPGCGKTRTMLELVDAGHGYVGDDRLLLTSKCRLVPLQGLLGLKMAALESDPRLRKSASPGGYRTARIGRRFLSLLRGALEAVPSRTTRQAAEALRRIQDDMERHVFLVDPRRALPRSSLHDEVDVATACLLSSGSPAIVEHAPRPNVKDWLLDAAAHEHEVLLGLLGAAALVDPRWKAQEEHVIRRQRTLISSAAVKIPAMRVRTPPGPNDTSPALQILSLPADTTKQGHVS